MDVPIIPDASMATTVALPPSSMGKLITLSQVSADNPSEVPIARSYDGHDFETLHPLLLNVTCIAGSCVIALPTHSGAVSMHYILQEYTPSTTTTEQEFARLLIQGTYGPTPATLSEAMSLGSAASWVQNQMNKPVTSLREHYRRRANAYTKNDLHHHGVRLACEAGSRWNRHAFSRWRDVGQTIVEEASVSGSTYLKINGIIRTEVDTAPSVAGGLPKSYVVCNYRSSYMRMSSFVKDSVSGVKGTLTIATSSEDCMSGGTAVDMPAVYFSSQGSIPSAYLGDLSDPNVLDTKILSSLPDSSTCEEDFKLTWPNFVKDEASGLYYVEDRRVELVDNTNGATAERTRMLDTKCPQVPKTFLNADTCVVRSDCTAPLFSGEFELNENNLRAFYNIDGRYVYRIENLPVTDTTTKSPCDTGNNDRTRFVRKNAIGTGCGGSDSSTAFPELFTALSSHLGGLDASQQDAKMVIDFYQVMGCDDGTTNDALGTSYEIALPHSGQTTCWEHVYPEEWSVFVFNKWSVQHPGNSVRFRKSEPNPIAKLAEEQESVFLVYPSWSWHQMNYHNNRYIFSEGMLIHTIPCLIAYFGTLIQRNISLKSHRLHWCMGREVRSTYHVLH